MNLKITFCEIIGGLPQFSLIINTTQSFIKGKIFSLIYGLEIFWHIWSYSRLPALPEGPVNSAQFVHLSICSVVTSWIDLLLLIFWVNVWFNKGALQNSSLDEGYDLIWLDRSIKVGAKKPNAVYSRYPIKTSR